MSVEVSHETGAPVAEESRRQGISVEALPERLLSESVTLAHAGVARELPLWHLELWVRFIGATSATMSVEPGMIDANVLVCAMDADAPHMRLRAHCPTRRVFPPPPFSSLHKYYASFIRSWQTGDAFGIRALLKKRSTPLQVPLPFFTCCRSRPARWKAGRICSAVIR